MRVITSTGTTAQTGDQDPKPTVKLVIPREQEHKENIAKSFQNMQVPMEYLRKNSKARDKKHFAFNKPALTFIALIHAWTTSDDKANSLANLIDILKYSWKFCKESRDQIIACLAYTLPIQDYIAVFLALAPPPKTIEDRGGWCRGSDFYDLFFSQLAEAVSKTYLNTFCKTVSSLVSQYLQLNNVTSFQMDEIAEALNPKDSKKSVKLSDEAQVFVKELIDPIIKHLLDTENFIPLEVKAFLHENRCYLTKLNYDKLEPLTQLCGLFFLKFTIAEIRNLAENLADLPNQTLTLIAVYIQKLTTQAKDKRLYTLVKAISEEETTEHLTYLPFRKMCKGYSPAMPYLSNPVFENKTSEEFQKILAEELKQASSEETKEHLRKEFAQFSAENFKQVLSDANKDATELLRGANYIPSYLQSKKEPENTMTGKLLARDLVSSDGSSSDDGGAEASKLQVKATEQTPLRPKAPSSSKARECDRWVTAKFVASSFPAVGGGLAANSILLQDVHLLSSDNVWATTIGPVWSSVIGAFPGLIFLLIVTIWHCRRDNSGNSKTTHRDNTSGRGVSTFHRKVADGSATEEDPPAHSFASADADADADEADAEEGETPRPGANQ